MSVFAVKWNPEAQLWEYDPEATAVAQLAGWETVDDIPDQTIPRDTAYVDEAEDEESEV